ncbi:hypothetical protein COZ60_02690 [Candidatus Bathyarchaeota archaeon CG_4_8_14_3_um_filter_42_8]|nr:MAG: hypothetical protein COZ60_02690 [Candidatus Bathyarchaeota archaeon CG_4_8_14_3_um_filter_42_8]
MTEKKGVRSVKVEDLGYVYLGICRGEDVWGNWHEDDWFCCIETKDGKTIDIAQLMDEVFGVGYTYCAMSNRGYECEEEREEGEECSYKDEKGICRPPLFRFKIAIEAEPLNTWCVRK